jgi:integrase/recombinase XerC
MTLEKFIDYIGYEKRYSVHTIKAYRTDLDQFYHFLEVRYGMNDIQSVDHMIIRSWLVELMDQHVTARSVNRKLSTLRSYFKFLIREGAINENPMAKVIPPKESKKLPVFVDREKMDFLFSQVDFGNDFEGIRDRLILELFYQTGMRLSELVSLKDSSIDTDNLTIKVLGKRNKERLMPITGFMRDILKNYQDVRSREVDIMNKEGYLFVTRKGEKTYPKLIYRIVTRYLGTVTTLEKKSPHILRHTFATHLLDGGADLNAVKELLGHANLSATQVYTHNTIEKLKKIYKQAHPRA